MGKSSEGSHACYGRHAEQTWAAVPKAAHRWQLQVGHSRAGDPQSQVWEHSWGGGPAPWELARAQSHGPQLPWRSPTAAASPACW